MRFCVAVGVVHVAQVESAPEFYLEYVKGREHVGRPTHRWQNDIKVDLKGLGCRMNATGFLIGTSGGFL